MAKKTKTVKQAREELRNISEAKRHQVAMLNYWKLRADKAYTDKQMLAQEAIIVKAEKAIEKIEAEWEAAPTKIAAIKAGYKQLEQRKAGITNRTLLARLKKITQQIREAEVN